MSKATTFVVLLLLLFSLCSAARPVPAGRDNVEAADKVVREGAQAEDSCNGISDDECLMRRTLNAHTDYIYTQNHNP